MAPDILAFASTIIHHVSAASTLCVECNLTLLSGENLPNTFSFLHSLPRLRHFSLIFNCYTPQRGLPVDTLFSYWPPYLKTLELRVARDFRPTISNITTIFNSTPLVERFTLEVPVTFRRRWDYPGRILWGPLIELATAAWSHLQELHLRSCRMMPAEAVHQFLESIFIILAF